MTKRRRTARSNAVLVNTKTICKTSPDPTTNDLELRLATTRSRGSSVPLSIGAAVTGQPGCDLSFALQAVPARECFASFRSELSCSLAIAAAGPQGLGQREACIRSEGRGQRITPVCSKGTLKMRNRRARVTFG